ncbi:hypothetical protein [Saccharothrix xinjiangensis]|uniref:Uncharacterized protein n=1 Tax=Saccharothrix xinjiangensis TaxID=204798 RepID=A0ABV9XV48_9PSEU
MVTQTAHAEQTQSPSAVAACKPAAWDCQMHTYMGSPENVATNLATISDSLVERRVYMLMVQGDDRAEAHLYERFAFEDDEGTVATWSDHKLGDMVSRLTEVLVGNGGAHCPGEQVKAQLATDHEFTVGTPTPAPKTAAEAFGPVLASFSGDKFVQATVMALC